MNTNAMMRVAFTALALTTLGLSACSNPTLNGSSDTAQGFHVPAGPYDNTANSLGGRYVGGGGDS